MSKKLCVYTVLIGDHELLNEQPIVKDSHVDFICFTDNKELVSQSWKLRHIKPVFAFDAARSSRIPKICPHRFLPEFDTSLYIDNTIVLKKTPEVIFEDLMGNSNVDFVCINHSYRETVLDEFSEVAHSQYDNLAIIAEQLNAYYLSDPDVLGEKPLKGGFLLRNHHSPAIVDAMEEWLAHVLRYSRRDQLSLNYILRRKKVAIEKLNIDVRDTEYFDWPVVSGRNWDKYKNSKTLSSLVIPTIAERVQGTQDFAKIIEEKERVISVLESEIKTIKKSRSWKFTKPFRILVEKYHLNSKK